MIIDLTHRLKDNMPVYPGDPKLKISKAATFKENQYMGHSVSMGTHSGTHVDAPAHMMPSGKTLGKFDIDSFTGRGRYVLVKDGVFSLEEVQKADIQPGDIVIFNTQMSYHYHKKMYFEDYPVMSEEIAHYLVERKVKMVGVDTCSIDNDPRFPIHKILLGSDILVLENLTNIEQLSGMEAVIYALPLKLDLDGAPARVIADVK